MRIPAIADLYLTYVSVTIRNELQHRFAIVVLLLTFLVEPIVYLTVWTTVTRQNGGVVAGMTTRTIAAYFIVWTLVRVVNIVFTPYGFEERIRRGEFNGQLLRPLHPIHYDLSWFIGMKVHAIVLWLPIGVLLFLLYRPDLAPTTLEVAVFVVALAGAYLVRSIYLWLLGLVTFWTTRTAALFEFVMLLELLLSGRLVPMSFTPQWMQTAAGYAPFYWAFGFPIEALVGRMSASELLRGVGMQVLWIVVGWALMRLVWRGAARRFSAVGN
jgi:ABC-2 type transport system permease protein